MKKTTKVFGFNDGFRPVLLRKKRRGGVLEDGSSGKNIGFKTGDTTESNSINIKEECLVKETSFNYGKSGAFAGGNPNQTLMDSKVKTKMLGKPLGKINFSINGYDNDILLDISLKLFSLVKNLVNISVHKSFALDIGLDQKKLVVIRKLFSKINDFGKVSTLSKFAGIIRTLFTFKLSLAQTSKKAEDVKILVNSNLKKSSKCLDQTMVVKKIPVETLAKTMCVALSEFGIIKSIKMQLVRLWQKAVVEFDQSDQADLSTALYSANGNKYSQHLRFHWFCGWKNMSEFLNVVMDTTPVLRDMNLHWSCLGFSKCAKYKKMCHMLLGYSVSGNLSSKKSSHRALLDIDKSRLATIYAKCLAPVAHFVIFVNSGFSLEMKPTLPNTKNIEKKFAVLKSGLVSLTEQINELAKRLNSFMLAVDNLVIEESLDKTTGGETAANLDSSTFSKVKRLENMLKGLSALVLSLTTRFDSSILAETKLKGKICLWIVNKFDSVHVFTSGYLGAEIYAGASLAVWFFQAGEINSMISKAVNESSFIVLGGDFNENGFHKCTSFKRCLDLGLVNFLNRSSYVKIPTWANFWGVAKTINFLFIFSNLVNVVVDCNVFDIGEFFDIDHQTVSMLVDLDRLLDVQLNSFYKQVNKDCWKFDYKNVEDVRWAKFKKDTAANVAMFHDKFFASGKHLDLDVI
ncbi:hypothetical protein G9A89_010831 [Geosiphon pyriformis]|nr:hypothetical protein G9A89_010831 [Geosiphon pyriformis]